MSKKQAITEKDGIHEQWYLDAKEVKVETLPEFVRHLTEDYGHDYGTICHAVAAAAIAAAHAVDDSPSGGITGFQAGAIMWEFISNWMLQYKDKPLRLLNYEDMLYPQYEDKFKEISKETWEWLQKEAQKNLDSKNGAHPNVKEHWENLVKADYPPFGYRLEK